MIIDNQDIQPQRQLVEPPCCSPRRAVCAAMEPAKPCRLRSRGAPQFSTDRGTTVLLRGKNYVIWRRSARTQSKFDGARIGPRYAMLDPDPKGSVRRDCDAVFRGRSCSNNNLKRDG